MSIDKLYKTAQRMIIKECSICPYRTFIHYPTEYCLYSFVNEARRCPFDHDLNKASKQYHKEFDAVLFWDKFTKRQLLKAEFEKNKK